MRGSWRISGVLLIGLLSCSDTTTKLPDAPQIVVFPDSQAFGSDVGFGTFIGTSPQQSFSITNGGKETLVISSVSKSGDSAFSFLGPNVVDTSDPQHPCETCLDGGIVESRQQAFVRVTFTPTQPKTYSGKLTITSNAQAGLLIATDGGSIIPDDPKTIEINLSGLGILAPDGGPDGG